MSTRIGDRGARVLADRPGRVGQRLLEHQEAHHHSSITESFRRDDW